MTYGGPTGANTNQYSTGSMKENIPEGYSKGSVQQFTPEQMNLFQQMFGNLGPDSYLSKLAGGDQAAFNQIEAPALRQFSGLQGNLASRFSGMGGLGARKSSGFQNTMNSAASNFAQELQSNRTNLMSNARKELFDMSNQLLNQRPYENMLVKDQPDPMIEFVNKLAGALPGAITAYATGGTSEAAKGGYNALAGLEDQFRTGQAYL